MPFFGICFGMQMAVIEAARQSGQPCPTPHPPSSATCDTPIVGLLTEWARGNQMERRTEHDDAKGGTMRLGAYPALLGADSLVRAIYDDAPVIEERHQPPLRGQRQFPKLAWRRPAYASPACPPTASCPRSSNCPATPGSLVCNTIRN